MTTKPGIQNKQVLLQNLGQQLIMMEAVQNERAPIPKDSSNTALPFCKNQELQNIQILKSLNYIKDILALEQKK